MLMTQPKLSLFDRSVDYILKREDLCVKVNAEYLREVILVECSLEEAQMFLICN